MALGTNAPASIDQADRGERSDRRVLWLDDRDATDPELTGAKASNLAVARRGGLPVLDGFVVTTVGTSSLDAAAVRNGRTDRVLHDAWRSLSDDGARPLAVRSSSVAEDGTASSMAGRFVSVLHVQGWDAFVDAVSSVLDSAVSTGLGDAPMAVLVQPMAEAVMGGVLFGLDPLTGDRSSLLVSVVDGLPEQIVSGAVTGGRLVLGRRGRLRSASGPVPAALGRTERRSLARLARAAHDRFGGPQDVEWLIEPSGTLRLLQSRPITATALPPERSRLLGPGPVAETFPDPLSRLERDLWLPPLEDGIREALRISGAASRRAREERLVVDVAGRVAVDLEALGAITPPTSWWRRLDPRPPARHLRAAWRIGRLRAAMPAIAHELVAEVDADLAAVPAVGELEDRELVTILRTTRRTLAALHAHEVLSGFFLDEGMHATTSASVALATVARDRADGLPDAAIVARHPVTLALVPPRIGGPSTLPPTPFAMAAPSGDGDDPMGLARESLRLRARWTQELASTAAAELGRRLARRGQLPSAADVRHLRFGELVALVGDVGITRPASIGDEVGAPLPARFRLAADGSVVPDVVATGDGPIGVSGGRAEALVTRDPAASEGRVLVVPTLDPGLAGRLGGLAALVSETGSPLSHLAILAREQRLPVVVGALDAAATLSDGDRVVVDGAAGTVEVLARAAGAPGPRPADRANDDAATQDTVDTNDDDGCLESDGVVTRLMRRCA